MKKTILVIVIVIFNNFSYAQTKQYKIIIDKTDNTTQEIWIQDIIKISVAGQDFTCGTSTVSYGGRIYNTVLIGSQCWFKQNLNIGTMINSNTAADSMKNNGVIEKYCYSNDTNSCIALGGFYQWTEAMQYVTTPGTKGICPTGWHIPTIAEFTTLKATVNNDGNALKSIGQGSDAGTGTNTSGFSALLAGYRSHGGYFNYLGDYAYFWSSTEYDASYAYNLSLINNGSSIYLDYNSKDYGFSVRCVKD